MAQVEAPTREEPRAEVVRPRLLRRSVDDLSAVDVERLRAAFRQLMQIEDNRGYQYLAGIHGLPEPIYSRHSGMEFLPWHRAYLLVFEQRLQDLDPGLTLPWWDWASARSRETGIPSAFSDPEVNGDVNPLAGARIDHKRWAKQPEDVPDTTLRDPAPPTELPTRDDVERVLALESFDTFAKELEQLHNHVHAWIGGTNGNVLYASYDPFFWVYQATIDRIWWEWQRAHPDQGPPRSVAYAPLSPFPQTVTDVWNPASLPYAYADPGGRFAAGAGSDLPATVDLLGFSDYAHAFADIIRAPETTPPLTIGIYGSWGMGKSSLLRLIAAELESEPHVHVVQLNAWEYNSSEKIWPRLVRGVMEEMERAIRWSYWSRFTDTVRRNFKRSWRRRRNQVIGSLVVLIPLAILAAWKLNFSPALIGTLLIGLGVPGAIKLVTDALKNPVSRWVDTLVTEDAYGDELPYMAAIRGDLEFLMHELTRAGDQHRILVMIDDLDRCEPEKAVEVLQAINLLLNFDSFIVCLGIDARIITAAVEAHYQQLLGAAGASGYEYLDKIVQIPFRIPSATSAEIQRFIVAQMPIAVDETVQADATREPETGSSRQEGGGADQDGQAQARGEQRSEASPEPSSDAEPERTGFDAAEVAAFQRIAPVVRRNPRHLKRLINVYRMVRTLAQRRGARVILDNPELTIRWIVTCAQWPYTVSAMLQEFESIVEEVDSGRRPAYPARAPLPELYSRAKATISADTQRVVDDDADDLATILRETTISWEQLRSIQPYTLNFNPAIEQALRANLWNATSKRAFEKAIDDGKRPGTIADGLLALVAATPGLSIPEAAEALNTSRSYLGRVVARLEREGKLRREADALHPPPRRNGRRRDEPANLA